MVQEYGAIGMLETREGYRRRGLARLLASSLSDHMQDSYIAGSRSVVLIHCREFVVHRTGLRISSENILNLHDNGLASGVLVLIEFSSGPNQLKLLASSLVDQMQDAYIVGYRLEKS